MKFSSIEELFKQLIPAEDQAQLVIYHQGKKVVEKILATNLKLFRHNQCAIR